MASGTPSVCRPLVSQMGVPEKVEHVIVSRIDKLSTKQGYILRMLSVIGSEFTIALISQYLEEPVVECRARVEELVQCGFLFARRFSAYTSVTCLQSERCVQGAPFCEGPPLGTALRDHQPPTTNRYQPPTAANRQPPPTANRRQQEHFFVPS